VQAQSSLLYQVDAAVYNFDQSFDAEVINPDLPSSLCEGGELGAPVVNQEKALQSNVSHKLQKLSKELSTTIKTAEEPVTDQRTRKTTQRYVVPDVQSVPNPRTKATSATKKSTQKRKQPHPAAEHSASGSDDERDEEKAGDVEEDDIDGQLAEVGDADDDCQVVGVVLEPQSEQPTTPLASTQKKRKTSGSSDSKKKASTGSAIDIHGIMERAYFGDSTQEELADKINWRINDDAKTIERVGAKGATVKPTNAQCALLMASKLQLAYQEVELLRKSSAASVSQQQQFVPNRPSSEPIKNKQQPQWFETEQEAAKKVVQLTLENADLWEKVNSKSRELLEIGDQQVQLSASEASNKLLQGRVNKLEADAKESLAGKSSLEKELAAANEELAKVRAELTAANVEAKELDDAEAEAVKRNQELTLELESEKRKVATKEARLIAVQMESHAKQKIVDDLQKQLKSKEGLLNTTTVESNSLKKNLAAKSDELVEVNGRLKKLNEDFVKVRESENKKGNELALLQNSLQTTIDNAVADATGEIRSVVDQQKSAFRALAEIAKKQAEDNKGVVDRLLKQIEEGEQQYAAIESS